MTLPSSTRETPRPFAVKAAVGLSVLWSIVGVSIVLAWPDVANRAVEFGLTVLFTILLYIALFFLWKGSHWGAVATLALNALNVLLALPGFFSDEAAVLVANAIYTLISLISIALLLSPSARAFWFRRQN